MKEIFANNLYLTSLSIAAGIYLTGTILLRCQIKSILIASISAIPQASFALILVYWIPERLSFFGIGLEDFIYSYFSGGIVWICSLALFANRFQFDFNRRTITKRSIICVIFAILSVSVLLLLEITNFLNAVLTMGLWIVFALIIKRDYFRIAWRTALLFLIVHTVSLKIGFIIWPELIPFWSIDHLTGLTFLKMPIEELIWAVLYGASWSLAVAYILNVQIKPVKFISSKSTGIQFP